MVTFRNQLLLLFIVLLSGTFLEAQAPIDSSLYKMGVQFHQKGIDFYLNGQMDSTIQYVKKAATFYQESKAYEMYLKELNTITSLLYLSKEYEEFHQHSLHTVKEGRRISQTENLQYANAINNLAKHYYDRGNYAYSITLYEEALKVLEKIDARKFDIQKNYGNQANAFIRMGDFQQALQFFEKKYQLLKSDSSTQPHQFAQVLNGIGEVYQVRGMLDEADQYYKQSLEMLVGANPLSHNKKVGKNMIRSLHESTRVALEKRQYQRAFAQIQKTMALQKDKMGDHRLSYSYELLGELQMTQQDYPAALVSFQTSLNLYTDYEISNVARKHQGIAEALRALNRLPEALEHILMGLKTLSPSFDDPNPFANPTVEQLQSYLEALDLLHLKAQIFNQQYQNNQDSTYLKGAQVAYARALEIISHLRKSVISTESKNQLSAKTVAIYEGAIQSACDLFALTKDPSYKELAFRFAESNKAQLLIETMNEQLARGIKGLPDSLLKQDKQIRLDIAFYEKKIAESVNEDSKVLEEAIQEGKDKLFDLKIQLNEITRTFEQDFPHYHDLKFHKETLDLPLLQKLLAQNKQAVLEYFIGEHQVYIFIVTNDQIEVINFELTESLTNHIQTLRASISKPPSNQNAEKNYRDFIRSALWLHQQLMEPALNVLPLEVKSLIVIPDYQMNYIPFELLLSEVPKEGAFSFAPSKLSYLLNKYSFSYDYSSLFYCKNSQKQRSHFQQGFVGFAPSFVEAEQELNSCRNGVLSPLECNQQEVQSINKLMRGKTRLKEQAYSQTFEELFPSSQIIHLATHACINESNTQDNRIFLSDNYISNIDLLNLRTNAELVVLSACNTGGGRLLKGEGLMSLARSFIQAGSASCILSRWSVDDCTTSEIMLHFYESLQQEENRANALRLSKLKFMENNDKYYQHPFYWGAFSIYGKTDQLDIQRSFFTPIPIMMIGLILLGGLSLFLYLRSR